MATIYNLPIQLISSCSTLGDFTPLYFRYEAKDHSIHTAQILEIVHQKEKHYNGIHELIFTCISKEESTTRYIDLKYNVGTHKWSIFRSLS